MYLYYPHAPILLRVVKHTKRANRVLSPDGGYRWEGYGRQGHITNTEAEAAIRQARLIVVTDAEAEDLKRRMPDLVAARIATSWSEQETRKLTAPPKRRTRRI
jgi:hypothetical protein